MKYKEIEFKYPANDLSLEDFKNFCKDRKPKGFVHASGYDHFYSKVGDPSSFCRHRIGADFNQLTFKRKTDVANNYIRTEHNIELDPTTSVEQISALCSEFGYEPKATIFKNCFIYVYDFYTLVYYIIYDSSLKELGRFMEIEMREDHSWESEEAAYEDLVLMEKLCKSIGASPSKRIKKSLFEMYAEGHGTNSCS